MHGVGFTSLRIWFLLQLTAPSAMDSPLYDIRQGDLQRVDEQVTEVVRKAPNDHAEKPFSNRSAQQCLDMLSSLMGRRSYGHERRVLYGANLPLSLVVGLVLVVTFGYLLGVRDAKA